MSDKQYTPHITIRWRPIDTWYGAECPDCGVSIIDTTVRKVKSGIKNHGKGHSWKTIKFNEQI